MGDEREERHRPPTETEQLEQAVVAALLREDRLSGYDFQVDANGKRVTLQGVVDVLAEKDLATEVARSVPGVESVENALTMSTDGDITDEGVEFEVAEELNADPRVQLKHVGVDVQRGVARLVGEVDSEGESQAAVEAASKARGVSAVRNEIKLREDHT